MLEMLLGLGFKDVFPPESPSHPLAARFGVWKWGKKKHLFHLRMKWPLNWANNDGPLVPKFQNQNLLQRLAGKLSFSEWDISTSSRLWHRSNGLILTGDPSTACSVLLSTGLGNSDFARNLQNEEKREAELWNGLKWRIPMRIYAYLCVSMPIYAYLCLSRS